MQNNRFLPFPVLETARLQLNRLRKQDAPGVLALHRFVKDAPAYIARIDASLLRGESVVWAVSFSETGEFIGSVCLRNLSPDGKSAEIGYELLPAYQGCGYMREAVCAVLDYGFSAAGFEKIFADLCADNVRSANLLQKIGFQKERERDVFWGYKPVKMAVYSITP